MRSLLLLALVACGPKTVTTPVATPSAPVGDIATVKTEAEALWNERGDKAKLEQSLERYAAIAAAEPNNKDALYHLLRGWYFKGDGHETEKEAKLAAWAVAIQWGDKCLAQNPQYAELLAKGDEDPASASRVFTKDDVPCVYWYASALGKWGKLSGITITLKHLPTVKAFMTKLGELDLTYYYAGHDRYWGAYYAAIPSFAGQDLVKSKEYFDKAIAAQPNFLGTRVLLAENWATKTQNKEVFQKELNWVLEQDAGVIPEVRPEAEAAQRAAKALLADMDSFFAN